mgnify:FL=1
MLASIAGSLVGSDWALDDNEAGSGNALYPNFMARVRAEEANRATYGIRVLEDPHGLYTSAARFEVDSICWALRQKTVRSVYDGLIIEWRGTKQYRCPPRRGLIYQGVIYEVDNGNALVLDAQGEPVVIWQPTGGRRKR